MRASPSARSWQPDPTWGTYSTAGLVRVANRLRRQGRTRADIARRVYAPFPVDGIAAWSDTWGAPRYAGGYHPHHGQDLLCAEGTPLLAVADAVVMTAGLEAPNFCPQLNRTVQALLVVLVHTAPTGELYASIYGHLSRIDVQAGASVSEGTVIGLSGNTGCSGTPHLHFGVGRSVAGSYVLIDPYGWHAPTGDPWELDPRGAASVWLWKDGAAPSLR